MADTAGQPAKYDGRRFRIRKPIELLRTGLADGELWESEEYTTKHEINFEVLLDIGDTAKTSRNFATLIVPESTLAAFPDLFEELK